MDPFRLDGAARGQLWSVLGESVETYVRQVQALPAGRTVDQAEVRQFLAGFDFDRPMDPAAALDRVVDGLRRFQPHVSHPRHFGLFDPAPTAIGVVADALAAAFNPCLASWAGSPLGVETDGMLVDAFARVFGYPVDAADGVVTGGGSEANLNAVLLALTARFPDHRESGLPGPHARPLIYQTSGAHPSIRKAAQVTGLGAAAVREVPTDSRHRMDPRALDAMVTADRIRGGTPLLVVVTAGTTGAGLVDPIRDVAEVAGRHGLWLHTDAAWGGAGMLVPELRAEFAGVERSDSITFDPHKWMSVPLGCGLFLTRRRGLLERVFGLGVDGFVADGDDAPAPDPCTRSIRWSRSFGSLKLLLSLAVAGWSGYESALRQQVWLGERLRGGLMADGWAVVNDTRLPVVCFVDGPDEPEERHRFLRTVARGVSRSGQAKIFVATLAGRPVLRAAITNYATTAEDVDLLVELLGDVRGQALARADDDGASTTDDFQEGACSAGAEQGRLGPVRADTSAGRQVVPVFTGQPSGEVE
ncbi:pyridoxal phosphate-dependent decarboxylase family protein [Virgisporangium aurantiacum]|uniref:pyridoxal phosphate-dependent decarboxylase family protein n=1 Tax=Virgisporangium aurantiacum TaxID=175570 RepID=UPI00194F1E74|nr:pyridoxal-dependent decarboxylase [Virgisporangium aurantiacum]